MNLTGRVDGLTTTTCRAPRRRSRERYSRGASSRHAIARSHHRRAGARRRPGRVVSPQRRSLAASAPRSSARGPNGWRLSLATMFVNLAIRALRWQYLLEPLGHDEFRATRFARRRSGFAASSVLPARAGEVIRPYFLARQAPTADGTDERDRRLRDDHSRAAARHGDRARAAGVVRLRVRPAISPAPTRRGFAAVKWAGASAGGGVASPRWSCCSCSPAIPARLGRAMARLEQVLPSALAGLIAQIAEKFARGLGAIRRPGRLLVALAWSFPLWLSICARHLGGRGGVSASTCRSPARFC